MAAPQCLFLALMSVAALVGGGVVPLDKDNRIYGGQQIHISKAPYQVHLTIGRDVCGGSIISPQWVLTAAHCAYGYPVSSLMIRIGSTSWIEGGKLHSVREVVDHEQYDPIMLHNDISLWKTMTRMDLGPLAKAVTLPSPGVVRPPPGTLLRVAGWGKLENGQLSPLLMAVDIKVQDIGNCFYGKNTPNEATQLCAGSPAKDSCGGDSGGALMMGNVEVGLVSYGAPNEDCAIRPTVYTYVAAYRDWIKRHSGV